MSAEVEDKVGIEGQGNKDPASLFQNHFVAQISGLYYDPSYEVTYDGRLQELDDKLKGFYIKDYHFNDPDRLLFRKNPTGCDIQPYPFDY